MYMAVETSVQAVHFLFIKQSVSDFEPFIYMAQPDDSQLYLSPLHAFQTTSDLFA